MSARKKQKCASEPTAEAFEPLRPARVGPDVTPWAEDIIKFDNKDQALTVLRHKKLLDKYWPRLLDIVTLLEANEATKSFETLLHWDLLKKKRLSVLFYGAQYSGKSQLIRTLSDHKDAIPLPGQDRTFCGAEGIPCDCPSGVNLIDTKGFEWPETEPPKSDKSAHAEWRCKIEGFEHRIKHLNERIRVESSADIRPLAVVVCVGAPRNPPNTDDLKRLLTEPHKLLVPTFLVLTNIFAVEDKVRAQRIRHYKQIAAEIETNARARNNKVNFVAVNSVDFVAERKKQANGEEITHKSQGIPEFVTTLLQNLDPMDGLTFARKVKKQWFGSSAPKSLDEEEKMKITKSILGEGAGSA